MRLFIAINFDEKVKNNLIKSIDSIKNNSVRCTLTKKENLHLTLAFIGEYNDKYKVIDILNKINPPKTILTIKKISSFKRDDTNLLYRDITVNDDLNNYVVTLRNMLKENNIPFDNKPFKAHITLSRNTILIDENNLNSLFQEEIEANIASITLYESRRINNELKYLSLFKKDVL